MKLVFIYGEPGVGKLTVARELVKLTGYKLFHNHLTVDLVTSVIPFGTKYYLDFVNKIRLDLVEIAAKSDFGGVVMTSVYGKGVDDSFIREITKRVHKYGGEVAFVKLHCDEKELRTRIKHPSRKLFKKITRLKTLKSVREKFDIKGAIPFVESLVIDNTEISPRKTAVMIQKYYNLK